MGSSVNLDTVNNYWDLDNGIFQVKGKEDSSYALRVTEDNEVFVNGSIIADGTLSIQNLGDDTDVVHSGNFTRIVNGAITTQKLEYNSYNYWNLQTGAIRIGGTRAAISNTGTAGLTINADSITVGTLKSNFIADGITFDKFTGLNVSSGSGWSIDFNKGKITVGNISANNIVGTDKISTIHINAEEVVSDELFVRRISAENLTGVQVNVTDTLDAGNIISGVLTVNASYTGWRPVGVDINGFNGNTYEEPETPVGEDEDIEIPDYYDPDIEEVEWETYTVPLGGKQGGLIIYDSNGNTIGKWDSDGIYATKGYFRYGGYGTGSIFYTTNDQYGSYLGFDDYISLYYYDKKTLTQFALIMSSEYDLEINSPNNTFLLGNTYLGYFDNDNVKETDDYGIAEIGVNCKTSGTGTSKRLVYNDSGARYLAYTGDVEVEVDEDGDIITDTKLHFVNGLLMYVGDL